MPKAWENVYTYTVLSQELNRCRKTVRKWVERGWLVGKWSDKAFIYGKKAMLFQYDDIVNFLKKYFRLFIDKLPENPFFRNVVKERIANGAG
jgi:hypothetical protein